MKTTNLIKALAEKKEQYFYCAVDAAAHLSQGMSSLFLGQILHIIKQ